MVTYESLQKVMDFINPNDFHILIDEYHLLFTEYNYRDVAIRYVLDNYEKFKSYTFMTCTPIEDEFLFDQLKDLPVEEAVWEDKGTIIIRHMVCKRNENKKGGINELISILNCLSGSIEPNLYIFVNSVKFINTMIKRNQLNKDNCRVIMSKNNKEGSTDCRTYPNTKYNDTVDHVYSLTRYSGNMTEDQFIAKMDAQEEDEKDYFKDLSNMQNLKNRIISFKKFNPTYFYLDESTNKILHDPRKRKIDLFKYRLANNVYNTTVNVMAAHKKSGGPQEIARFKELILLFENVFEMENFKIPDQSYLQQLLEKDSFFVFVAIAEGKVVGGLTAYTLHQYYYPMPIV